MRTKAANISNISNSVYNPLGFSFVFNGTPIFEQTAVRQVSETGRAESTHQLISGNMGGYDVDNILDNVNMIPRYIVVPVDDD